MTTFDRPADFNDETFTVNAFRALAFSFGKYNYVHTTSNVTPRNWELASNKEKMELEDIEINIQGVTNEQYKYVFANGSSSTSTITNPTFKLQISPTKSPLNVYMVFENKHHLFSGLEAGQNYDFDISNFTAPDVISASIPESDNVYMSISGKIGEEYLQVARKSITDGSTTINLSLVKSFFTTFKTFMEIRNTDMWYKTSTIGNIPSSYSIPSYEINIEDDDINNFTASSTGGFNILLGQWSYSEGSYSDNTLDSFDWLVYREAGEKITIPLSELPTEIKNKYGIDVSKASYKHTRLTKHTNIDTYNQFLDLILSPNSSKLYEEYEQVTVNY